MDEKEPKSKVKPTGELGLPSIPDKPMDPEMKAKLDEWTAEEQAKAKTPEEQVDVLVRRARTLAAAGFYDAASKAYNVANDRAMSSGLYQLSGKIINEILVTDSERSKQDNETRAAQEQK